MSHVRTPARSVSKGFFLVMFAISLGQSFIYAIPLNNRVLFCFQVGFLANSLFACNSFNVCPCKIVLSKSECHLKRRHHSSFLYLSRFLAKNQTPFYNLTLKKCPTFTAFTPSSSSSSAWSFARPRRLSPLH